MTKTNKFQVVGNKTDAKVKELSFNTIMGNLVKVGPRNYAMIPVDLLFVDERFQREVPLNDEKVRILVRDWDDNKMDALKVSVHKEENAFSVVDGGHRLLAAIILGLKYIRCEVLDLSEDLNERLQKEAEIFIKQSEPITPIKPLDRHNGALICKIPENVALQELVEKYNIPLKRKAGHGKVVIGHLAGFDAALKIIKSYGKETFDHILYILCSSRWNMEAMGLGSDTFRLLKNIFLLHPDKTEEIISSLISYFSKITPRTFFSAAITAYPNVSLMRAYTMYLEDYLCDQIGMERVFMKDSSITRVHPSEVAV